MSSLTSVPSISTTSKIECIKCKKFITRGNIQRHSKSSNCDNPTKMVIMQKVECEVCKKLIKKEYMQRHLMGFNCHSSMTKCSYCDENIKTNILRHKRSCKYVYKFIRKASSGFECTLCNSNHSKRGSLYIHLQDKHKISKPQDAADVTKCSFCQEMMNLNVISKHRNICKYFYQFMKKTSSGYECTFCSNNIIGRSQMYLHLERKHNISNGSSMKKMTSKQEKVVCELCKKFISKANVLRHQKLKCKALKKKCPYCEEIINGSNLLRHKNNCKYFYKFARKISSGYECTVCSSNYSKRGSLYAHLEEIHSISKSEDVATMRKCKFCQEKIKLVSIKSIEIFVSISINS